jgi:hypothetical protein
MPKKYSLWSLMLTLVMLTVATNPSAALAAGPSGQFGSTISCTNLGSGSAFMSITFYNADSGTQALTYGDSVPVLAGSSRVYFTPSVFGSSSSFVGSGVVSSDQPAICNVTTQLINAGVGTKTNPARFGTASGFSDTDLGSTLYLPQLEKAFYGWNSYFAVQNTESTAISVTATYGDRNGVPMPAASQTVSLQPQTSHVFYQSDNANLPSNYVGSAVVTSSGGAKLAASAAMYNASTNNTTSQLQTYSAAPTGGNKLYAPRFARNYYGFSGGMTIQNLGPVSTTVGITWTINNQTFVLTTTMMSPGAAYFLYAPDVAQLAGVDKIDPLKRYGSAIIQANAPTAQIIALINEDNRGTCRGVPCPAIPAQWVGWGSTYNAIPDGTQTGTVWFPRIMRNLGGFSSGFQVANTTAIAGTCNLIFPDAPAANQTNVTLAASGNISYFAPNIANLPDGYNSSVEVVCTQPVVGISNSSSRTSTYYGDSATSENGFNR